MKQQYFYLLGILFLFPCFFFISCNNEEDTHDYISATSPDIVGTWNIKSITGNNTHSAWLNVDNTLTFNSNGTCITSLYMENAYKIENGQIHTYYESSGEPMFIYTIEKKEGNTITVKMSGTLDDNTSLILLLQKINTNGHECVNLGLPSGILWAKTNVGYTESSEKGYNYMFNQELPNNIWGGDWEIPTIEDYQELYEHCTYIFNVSNEPILFTSKKNGATIEFPLTEAYFNYSLNQWNLRSNMLTNSRDEDSKFISFNMQNIKGYSSNKVSMDIKHQNIDGYLRLVIHKK